MRTYLLSLAALMWVGCPVPDDGCRDDPSVCGPGTVCDPASNRCGVLSMDMASSDATGAATDMTSSTDMTLMAWIPQASGTTSSLNGIWGADASNIWVVGGSGTIV